MALLEQGDLARAEPQPLRVLLGVRLREEEGRRAGHLERHLHPLAHERAQRLPGGVRRDHAPLDEHIHEVSACRAALLLDRGDELGIHLHAAAARDVFHPRRRRGDVRPDDASPLDVEPRDSVAGAHAHLAASVRQRLVERVRRRDHRRGLPHRADGLAEPNQQEIRVERPAQRVVRGPLGGAAKRRVIGRPAEGDDVEAVRPGGAPQALAKPDPLRGVGGGPFQEQDHGDLGRADALEGHLVRQRLHGKLRPTSSGAHAAERQLVHVDRHDKNGSPIFQVGS